MRRSALTESEQSYLIRLLSDQESGHARQWYWLEIAQTLPPPDQTRRAYCLGIAIKLLGNQLCSPILLRLRLKGCELYQASATRLHEFGRQKINDALLFSGSLIALLAGFQRLPASLQFAAWCLGFGGAAWHLMREMRQTTKLPEIEPTELEGMDLPGAESSLGLPSILLAAGIAPQLSLSLVKGIKQDPQAFIEPLLINLPMLQPEIEPSRAVKCGIGCFAWLALAYLISGMISALPQHWGTVSAILSLSCFAALLHRRKNATLLMMGTWLSCFALASAAHYI